MFIENLAMGSTSYGDILIYGIILFINWYYFLEKKQKCRRF